jgi:hypothetical protein
MKIKKRICDVNHVWKARRRVYHLQSSLILNLGFFYCILSQLRRRKYLRQTVYAAPAAQTGVVTVVKVQARDRHCVDRTIPGGGSLQLAVEI